MPRGTQRHAYRSQVVPRFHQQNHTRTWADWRLVNLMGITQTLRSGAGDLSRVVEAPFLGTANLLEIGHSRAG
jgi:hypothetical protein